MRIRTLFVIGLAVTALLGCAVLVNSEINETDVDKTYSLFSFVFCNDEAVEAKNADRAEHDSGS